MGLDIIFCQSRNWDESFRALELKRKFNELVDWKTWNPDWWAENGKQFMKNEEKGLWTSECDPYTDPRSKEICNRHLQKFCQENTLLYKEDSIEGGYIGDIDDGIIELEQYQLRSSYNDCGTNKILKSLGLPDFYRIFNPPDETGLEKTFGYFKPDWENVRKTTDKVYNTLQASNIESLFRQMERIKSFFRVLDVNGPEIYRVLWSY